MILKDPLIGKSIHIPRIIQKKRSTAHQKSHTVPSSKNTPATYSKQLCVEATNLFYTTENNTTKKHFKHLQQIIAAHKQKNKFSSLAPHSRNIFQQTLLLMQIDA
jgi:hypothetical protein